jgi:uncharacterized SAM-binding protein YcdF (DUF218 family)
VSRVVQLLKAYFHLGSPLFVVTTFGLCAAWLILRPRSRAARWMLAAVCAGYWIAATPIGSGLLVNAIGHGYGPLSDAAAAGGADTVVVLSGGEMSYMVGGIVLGVPAPESAMRTLEAARVYQLIGHGTIVVTGGRVYPSVQLVAEADVLKRILLDAGVPDGDIVVEDRSRNTREQAVNVTAMLKARGITRFVLVTAKTHMRRSLAAFRVLGMDPIPSASPTRSEQLPRPPWLVPAYESLTLSDAAIYDMAASVYYWAKGWQ